jgi:hypothetical protein
MRRLLPSRVELAIFAVLALIAAASVGLFQPNTHDLSMAAFAGPIFLFAAVLGLRRSPVWTAAAEEEETD